MTIKEGLEMMIYISLLLGAIAAMEGHSKALIFFLVVIGILILLTI